MDARHGKADLLAIVRENSSCLQALDRIKLFSMLLKFELLFNNTLGDWNLLLVSFELNEGMKPYLGRPFTILHKHKAVPMKKIKRLCNIRVFKWQTPLQWASPLFIILKKDSTGRTVSDLRELNKHIVRNSYPIPKISPALQELEGFTYATAFDLNMGYYTIRLYLCNSP